ncbi:MAG: hypothetical protein OGM15_02165 [Lachnospiraceae bacterium]|nr:MAG: hypothetical protein OGM15_02165 [Lachnospiraceae bacterium]
MVTAAAALKNQIIRFRDAIVILKTRAIWLPVATVVLQIKTTLLPVATVVLQIKITLLPVATTTIKINHEHAIPVVSDHITDHLKIVLIQYHILICTIFLLE